MIDKNFWKKRRVLLTGHTGFKGSWFINWLSELGADICGYSLEPDKKSLFNYFVLKNEINFQNVYGDIRDKNYLEETIIKFKPEIVFHFAAQPLVLESYASPLTTWQTNLIGTLNLLESLKNCTNKCSILVITTDKVYKNKEWIYGYREIDELGGHDPYSASKAATEIAVESWKKSFIESKNSKVQHLAIATARSGNVIGGGDWSENRIIPDAIRSLTLKKSLLIRNPSSTRPWQHVLEPLCGYLILSEKLYNNPGEFSGAFNFGPELESNRTVEELINEVFKHWGGSFQKEEKVSNSPHEAGILNLDISKSSKYLDWKPIWDFETTIEKTISWYKQFYEGQNPTFLCKNDLKSYIENLEN